MRNQKRKTEEKVTFGESLMYQAQYSVLSRII